MAFAADWVFLPICLLPLALAAVVFGLRGRRLDEHPFCRQCGFDLAGETGRPAGVSRRGGAVRSAGSRPSSACPECGTNLRRRRAVGLGRRQRRRGLVAAGMPAMLLCLAWLGAAGWYAAETCDWQAYKPTWWLAAEAGGSDAGRRDAAVRELTDRVARGKLARPRIDELTRRALAFQADKAQPWTPAWGDWLERVHDAGLLSEEQWRRYASQAVCFRLEARPNVRRGDPFVVRLSVAPARVAKGRRFSLDAGFAGDVWLDGQRIPAAGAFDRIVVLGGISADGADRADGESPASPAKGIAGVAGVEDGDRVRSRLLHYDLKPALLARLGDGPHRCRVAFDALVGERPDGMDPLLAEAHVELEAPWRLLPEGEQSVRLLRGQAAPVGRVAVSSECRWADDTHQRISVRVFCQNLPVSLACALAVRAGADEWPAGTLAWAKGSSGASVTVQTALLPATAGSLEKVDVVLRPSAAVAARTIELNEIWGERIVVPDVEVAERHASVGSR